MLALKTIAKSLKLLQKCNYKINYLFATLKP